MDMLHEITSEDAEWEKAFADSSSNKPLQSAAQRMKHVFVTWGTLQAAEHPWDKEKYKCQWKLGQKTPACIATVKLWI